MPGPGSIRRTVSRLLGAAHRVIPYVPDVTPIGIRTFGRAGHDRAELRARVDAQLEVGPREARLHRLGADGEVLADDPVGETGSGQACDALLAGGQLAVVHSSVAHAVELALGPRSPRLAAQRLELLRRRRQLLEGPLPPTHAPQHHAVRQQRARLLHGHAQPTHAASSAASNATAAPGRSPVAASSSPRPRPRWPRSMAAARGPRAPRASPATRRTVEGARLDERLDEVAVIPVRRRLTHPDALQHRVRRGQVALGRGGVTLREADEAQGAEGGGRQQRRARQAQASFGVLTRANKVATICPHDRPARQRDGHEHVLAGLLGDRHRFVRELRGPGRHDRPSIRARPARR